jgi:hypothetical protein
MKLYTPNNRYRSPFASLEEHGQIKTNKSSTWGLRDILREKRLREQLQEVGSAFRQRHDQSVGPRHKFTVVRRRSGGFHATGIGFLPLTFAELKVKVRLAGYTHIRMGAMKTDVRGVAVAKN